VVIATIGPCNEEASGAVKITNNLVISPLEIGFHEILSLVDVVV